jgi:hypothetical protein
MHPAELKIVKKVPRFFVLVPRPDFSLITKNINYFVLRKVEVPNGVRYSHPRIFETPVCALDISLLDNVINPLSENTFGIHLFGCFSKKICKTMLLQ